MALSKLDTLYRQVIVDHSSKPHHFGTLEKSDSSHEIELHNPTCGDVITLQLDVKDDKINDIAFSGSGCSISTASASMMTDAVLGKSVKEAKEMVMTFSEMVQGNEDIDTASLGDAALLSGVAKFPARIKCSTLAWKALYQALDENKNEETVGHLHQDLNKEENE